MKPTKSLRFLFGDSNDVPPSDSTLNVSNIERENLSSSSYKRPIPFKLAKSRDMNHLHLLQDKSEKDEEVSRELLFCKSSKLSSGNKKRFRDVTTLSGQSNSISSSNLSVSSSSTSTSTSTGIEITLSTPEKRKRSTALDKTSNVLESIDRIRSARKRRDLLSLVLAMERMSVPPEERPLQDLSLPPSQLID